MLGYSCPCCRSSLLRHVRKSAVYWFCPSCRQEMPEQSVTRSLLSESLRITADAQPPQPKTAA